MKECTVIVSGSINSQDKVDEYRGVAGAVMNKYGATFPPTMHSVNEVVAGSMIPTFMMEIEFPDREKAVSAFNDPDYKEVIALRDEGFGDLSIYMIE